MINVAMSHHIAANEQHSEIHFSIGGYWATDAMHDFLEELTAKTMPLIGRGKTFCAIGEMEGFVAQNQDCADAIRDNLLAAKSAGLQRVAIVKPSALVKIQYRRISKGIDVAFFDNKPDALHWLRAAA